MTFEMERQRNRPVKYNRELVKKTVSAVKKIDEIRARRGQRMKLLNQLKNKKLQKKQDKRMLKRDLPLVKVDIGKQQIEEDVEMDVEQQQEKIKIRVGQKAKQIG